MEVREKSPHDFIIKMKRAKFIVYWFFYNSYTVDTALYLFKTVSTKIWFFVFMKGGNNIKLVTIRQLAATNILSEYAIRQMVKQNIIPYITRGKKVLLDYDLCVDKLRELSLEQKKYDQYYNRNKEDK